jgi:hypothetical protein
MGGYYAILESLLKFKDRDMKKFQEVVEGGWGGVVTRQAVLLA